MRELPVEPGKMLESQGKGSYFQSTKKIKCCTKNAFAKNRLVKLVVIRMTYMKLYSKKWAGFLESLEIKI